ncbi:hypothetical protein FF255_18635, partial [Bordetella pertussis]
MKILKIGKGALPFGILDEMARIGGQKEGDDRCIQRLNELVVVQFATRFIKIAHRLVAIAQDLLCGGVDVSVCHHPNLEEGVLLKRFRFCVEMGRELDVAQKLFGK